MYVVYINLLCFLSIFLFTYNKNLLSQKKVLVIICQKMAIFSAIYLKSKGCSLYFYDFTLLNCDQFYIVSHCIFKK